MSRSFASVSLFSPIRGSGFAIVARVNVKQLEALRQNEEFDQSIEKFLTQCVSLSSDGELLSSSPSMSSDDIASLSQPDVNTFMEIMVEMLSPDSEEIKKLCSDIEGDGFSRPIYVPLLYPISFGEQVISGLELSAKTFAEIRDLFRSSGVSTLSRDLLRRLARPVGAEVALSDSILDRMDFIDYYRIRDGALGKLQGLGQRRWSRL